MLESSFLGRRGKPYGFPSCVQVFMAFFLTEKCVIFLFLKIPAAVVEAPPALAPDPPERGHGLLLLLLNLILVFSWGRGKRTVDALDIKEINKGPSSSEGEGKEGAGVMRRRRWRGRGIGLG